MRREKDKQLFLIAFVLLIATVPLWMHVAWLLQLHFRFTEIQFGKDVILMELDRIGAADPSAFPIQIIGTYGDIYQPQLRNVNRSYDLVVLSATLDPLYTIDEMVIWKSNLLVRSFFAYAYDDESLVKSGLRNLIIRMLSDNKAFVEYLSSEPIRNIRYNQDYAAELCEPFIARVPKGSRLDKAGIRWYAVLPLFNSKHISNVNERDDRLSLNVKIAVGRLLNDLSRLEEDWEEYRVRVIAIPALAGSEKLQDSQYYLKYVDSFGSIVNAIKGVPLPKSLERIYLVAWDKWEHILPEEGKCAISGLREVYNRFMFPQHGIKWIAYSVLFSFGIAYLTFWFQSNVKESRRLTLSNGFTAIVIILVSQLGNFLVFGEWLSTFLKTAYNFSNVLLITLELILGLSAVFLAYKFTQIKFKEFR